jgi:hypothetical protein
MGYWRFRRTAQLIPGVRLNLNKSSVSTRFGVRGAGYTIGPKGERVTVGLPGTGLSYTEQSTKQINAVPRSFWQSFWKAIGIGLLVAMSIMTSLIGAALRRR